jgi:CHAT domain-containing protein
MAYRYPALTATQMAPVLSIDQARTLTAELNATLVEYYRHAEGWCAFVVTPKAIHHVPLQLVDDDLLERMANWMLRLEYPVGRNRLSNVRLSEWHDVVIAPLKAYLPQERPIVIAPFDVLHVLPLAAALNPHTGRYLAEDYQIAFAPSLSALCVAWDQAHRTANDGQGVSHHLLNVAYPGTPGSNHYLLQSHPR